MPWTNDKIPESPYGVICPTDGKQGLSYEEYMRQLNQADSLWKCPGCGGNAQFDEDRYEGSVVEDEQIEDLFDRTDWPPDGDDAYGEDDASQPGHPGG